jgi:NADPH:quinone reductase-like Zn-dependent oxidoreductase
MKAVVQRCYGPSEVLRLEDIAKPSAQNDSVLVRVHTASLNPHDWHVMRGTPYLIRLLTGFGAPRNIRGSATDFAGTVEAVGKDVRRFRVGDEVVGSADGALAQYVTVRDSDPVVAKLALVSFEQAAAVPVAAVTALQALRDLGHVHAGENVLINGASGGVGTFAVQLAKLFGADVTAVCSTRNVEMVRLLGADHLIDYTKEDFTKGTARYELILDLAANRSLSEYRSVLAPQGLLTLIGASPGNWLGPLGAPLEATMLEPFSKQKFPSLFAHINQEDLTTLAELMQSGKLKSVIDRHYSLGEVPDAMAYLESGHARGKVVIDVE